MPAFRSGQRTLGPSWEKPEPQLQWEAGHLLRGAAQRGRATVGNRLPLGQETLPGQLAFLKGPRVYTWRGPHLLSEAQQ